MHLRVSPSYRRALHDAFEVDEVQVIGCGGAGSAIAHCVHHLGSYSKHTHTMKRARDNYNSRKLEYASLLTDVSIYLSSHLVYMF